MGILNATFEVVDASLLDACGLFDLVTAFYAIHDLAQPSEVLKSIIDSLKPGGTYIMGEFAASSHLNENVDHMLGPTLYGVSVMYCMTISLAYGGAGLGTMWGEHTAREFLEDGS